MGILSSNPNENYDNDPYLNQNTRDRNLLNSIYSNNSSVIPLHESGNIENSEANAKILADQQQKKKTKAYKNPIKLDRNTIKLERDAYNKNIYYIEFTYTSEKNLFANFYFNAALNRDASSNFGANFIPYEKLSNSVVQDQLSPGNSVQYQKSTLFFDMDFFNKNKIYDREHSDLIIELIALNTSNQVECILATFCKVLPDSKSGGYHIKSEMQKYKVGNSAWYDMQDIFGITSDSNECEICCSAKKNTFFLPCKHSYACKDCAIMLRIKGNHCPICRQSKLNLIMLYVIIAISDSVVIENTEAS